MAHFSRLQITLHWLTLLLTGTYMLLLKVITGVSAKRPSVYLFMKDTHHDSGRSWFADVFTVISKHKYPIQSLRLPPHWQHVAAKLMHIALYLTSFLALPLLGQHDTGGKKLELFWFYCTGIFDAR